MRVGLILDRAGEMIDRSFESFAPDFVCLPEYFSTLKAKSKELVYNTSFLFKNGELLGKYRKLKKGGECFVYDVLPISLPSEDHPSIVARARASSSGKKMGRERGYGRDMNIYHITYAPAIKMASLYFWGCNFSCRGCIRKKELRGYLPTPRSCLLNLEEVIDNLRIPEIEKVVFMGGEPTIDPMLPELARSLHEELSAYNILLTNGFLLPSIENVDEICLSIKAYTDALHKDFTGKSNENVLENFVDLHQSGIRLRSESILIPNYIDCEEIERIARFIASVDPSIPYRIDSYIHVPCNPWRPPTKEEVDKVVSVAKKYLRNVSCLKGDESLKYEVVRIV